MKEGSDKIEHGQLRLLSYNIHKGLNAGNRSVILEGLRSAVHSLGADFLLLQEVVGSNQIFQSRFDNWSPLAQHEFLKSELLSHACYGLNAQYAAGSHGNAILSKHPHHFERNTDISTFKFSRRGVLHTKTIIPGVNCVLHTICTHFGLVEQERLTQLNSLCEYVQREVPADEPLVIGGDFNDWREKLTAPFEKKIGVKEVFMEFYGSHARSFPSWLPISCLDRIYYRNLILKSCKRLSAKPWSRLSDHLPLIADFNYP